MSISFSNLSAIAQCPGGPVHPDTNTTIKGIHSGKIRNTGPASVTCQITVSVADSDAHSNKNTMPFDVDAGQERSFSYETPLLVSYSSKGQKTVTARTDVKAEGKSDSASGRCSFQVT